LSEAEKQRRFVARLLEWWQKEKIAYPWRAHHDPYKVLIAELLLRKTTAKQVAKIYDKFISIFPNPKALAQAEESIIERILEPLGMHKVRAKLFKKLGATIAYKLGGGIPRNKEELLNLPGVKEYVANAVLCFAYGEDEPLVDTNVIRVLQRVLGFTSSKARPKDDPALWGFVKKLIPKGRAREFNLALIDFAHKMCTSKNPRCSSCILQDLCAYHAKISQ